MMGSNRVNTVLANEAETQKITSHVEILTFDKIKA